MISNIHSDVSYLSVTNGRIRTCDPFFLGWMPQDIEAIKQNGEIFTLYTIPKSVEVLVVEAAVGALFMCVQAR